MMVEQREEGGLDERKSRHTLKGVGAFDRKQK